MKGTKTEPKQKISNFKTVNTDNADMSGLCPGPPECELQALGGDSQAMRQEPFSLYTKACVSKLSSALVESILDNHSLLIKNNQ